MVHCKAYFYLGSVGALDNATSTGCVMADAEQAIGFAIGKPGWKLGEISVLNNQIEIAEFCNTIS